MDENVLYIVPEATTLATPGKLEQYTESIREKKQIPKLKEVIEWLKEDIDAAGLETWEVSIEAHITVGKETEASSVEAGIRTTLTFSNASQ